MPSISKNQCDHVQLLLSARRQVDFIESFGFCLDFTLRDGFASRRDELDSYTAVEDREAILRVL